MYKQKVPFRIRVNIRIEYKVKTSTKEMIVYNPTEAPNVAM